MLAAQYLGDRSIDVRDVDTPPLEAGQVRIAVSHVGICGTDLHVLHGSMDSRVTLPAVIGHEMSGVLDEIGPDVEGWSVGDRVTVMPLAWDGTCPACLAGNRHICQNLDFIGIDSSGALQQRWTVPASVLVALPDGVSLEHAALIEPVAVAAHDVRRSEAGPGDRAVVVGAGPIGVLIATVAKARGISVVIAEIDPGRRALAEELGLATVDPSALDLTAWVDEWTGGAGADVVFEVSGSGAALASALQLPKVRGTLVVVAIHAQPRQIDLHRVFWRELRILGARVYEREDFEAAAELVASGAIPADRLITQVVPLTEVREAFALLEQGGAMKVLVDVAGGAA